MADKYHIASKPVAPRLPRIGKCGVVDWREDCAGCHNCVKKACVFDRYRQEGQYIRSLNDVDSLFFECMGCFSCVQSCTKGLLSLSLNPEYAGLGNSYWNPDIIHTTWAQAETGKIPVSGAGYRGKFSGDGFDSMWTDMSEIVRPTRDGIHGREYISTAVDIGRKPSLLNFEDERLTGEFSPVVEIPMPLIIDLMPPEYRLPKLIPIFAEVAARTGLLMEIDLRDFDLLGENKPKYLPNLILSLCSDEPLPSRELLGKVRMMEISDGDDVEQRIKEIKKLDSRVVVSVRVDLDSTGEERAVELAQKDYVEVLHLKADINGNQIGVANPKIIKDMVRHIHNMVVKQGIRDQVTIIAGGGIALAEHMAKQLICGADLVSANLPLLVALECHLCDTCVTGRSCPARIEDIEFDYGAGRIINLIAAWHDQLIEVMGAMGIREARRLRGEVGRAMFFKDIEEETFGKLFGTRKSPETTEKQKSPNGQIPQTVVSREVRPAPSRFRNEIAKYIIRRNSDCTLCGKCAQVCLQGVHILKPGYKYFMAPRQHVCVGPACEKTDHNCVALCPQKALQMVENPMMKVMGDYRWTADMILATWKMAETGEVVSPDYGYEYRVGTSGGGFDRLRFKFPEKPPVIVNEDEIDTSIELNRRNDGRLGIRIDVPWYGGGMSFGSVSIVTQLAKARAATAFNTFTCTGEGGYMERLRPYDDHVITQVATGLFGVREETIQRVRIVEFKYAQGAKPGLGGHLLADKVTSSVAKMRETVLGISLFSPFPFHSVYSIEDHQKHMDWIKHLNRKALISTKVSTPADVDMVAVGSYSAGTHIVHMDGSYGGTGAAPDIAKKNIALPIEYAIVKVHKFLEQEGVRDKVTLMASGGIRTAHDIAKAIAMGADGVVVGTAELVALGCVRCSRCESGRGCPRGIATTDEELSKKVDVEWGSQRIINLYTAWQKELIDILKRFGMRNISELRGRSDLLIHLDYENNVVN